MVLREISLQLLKLSMRICYSRHLRLLLTGAQHLDQVQNLPPLALHAAPVQQRTPLDPPVLQRVTGQLLRVAQHVNAAVVAVALLKALRFAVTADGRQAEESQQLVAELHGLLVVHAPRRVEVEHHPLRVREHQQTPVGTPRRVDLFVVVEREEDEVPGLGVERIQEDCDFRGGGHFYALRNLRRHKQIRGVLFELTFLQVFEVEGYHRVVEPARSPEQLYVGNSKQAFVETQHDRIILHFPSAAGTLFAAGSTAYSKNTVITVVKLPTPTRRRLTCS